MATEQTYWERSRTDGYWGARERMQRDSGVAAEMGRADKRTATIRKRVRSLALHCESDPFFDLNLSVALSDLLYEVGALEAVEERVRRSEARGRAS